MYQKTQQENQILAGHGKWLNTQVTHPSEQVGRLSDTVSRLARL